MSEYIFSDKQRTAFTFDNQPESRYMFLNRQGAYVMPPEAKLHFIGSIEFEDIADLQTDLNQLVEEITGEVPVEGDLVNVLNIPKENAVSDDQYIYSGGVWTLFLSGVERIKQIELTDSLVETDPEMALGRNLFIVSEEEPDYAEGKIWIQPE